MRRSLCFVLASKLLTLQLWNSPVASAAAWLPQGFPNPDHDSCRSGASKRLCDPDSVLSTNDAESIAQYLGDVPSRKVMLPRKCFPSPSQAESVQVQYGVAVLRKMNLASAEFRAHRDNPDAAAEIFARQVHDTWGVGLETPSCGGTGILLFLSIEDRTVFFSRGTALESVFTNRRLDKTIEAMKPYLLERDYGQALLFATRELDSFLVAGVPNWTESSLDFVAEYFGYFFLAGFFSLFVLAASHERKQRREYAAVASHLNELDRARAEALQGRFDAKSCPICLENFTFAPATNTDNGSSPDNETEPLVCTGSDGLPLKLLRCGHVFDETCWADWINSGHGKTDKCPICQQDVGRSPAASRDGVAGSTMGANQNMSTAGSTYRPQADGWVQTGGDLYEEARNRALRQYTYDRNFRLLRLASRYPRYIRPQHIQSWTQVGYDGTLARDPSFVNSDPARQSASSGSNGSSGFRRSGGSGSSSFGGGFSGGGRGGRW